MYKQSCPPPPLSLFPADIPPGCVFTSSPLCTFNRLGWEGLFLFLLKISSIVFDLSPPCIGWPLGALRVHGGKYKLNSMALGMEFKCQAAKFFTVRGHRHSPSSNRGGRAVKIVSNDIGMHVEIRPIFVSETSVPCRIRKLSPVGTRVIWLCMGWCKGWGGWERKQGEIGLIFPIPL